MRVANPRIAGDNLGTMFFWANLDKNMPYKELGDSLIFEEQKYAKHESPIEFLNSEFTWADIIMPLYLIDETRTKPNGNLRVSLEPPRIAGKYPKAGIIYFRYADIMRQYGEFTPDSVAKVHEAFRSEIENYNHYLESNWESHVIATPNPRDRKHALGHMCVWLEDYTLSDKDCKLTFDTDKYSTYEELVDYCFGKTDVVIPIYREDIVAQRSENLTLDNGQDGQQVGIIYMREPAITKAFGEVNAHTKDIIHYALRSELRLFLEYLEFNIERHRIISNENLD